MDQDMLRGLDAHHQASSGGQALRGHKAWIRPEIRRLAAGSAELNPGILTDAEGVS